MDAPGLSVNSVSGMIRTNLTSLMTHLLRAAVNLEILDILKDTELPPHGHGTVPSA